MYAAEGQQWLNLHTDIFHLVQEGVFDNQPIGIALEKQRFLEIEFSDTIVIHWHAVGGEFLQIFVSFRVDDFVFILVDAQMKIHAVNHDVLVDAGDQQVAFAAEIVLRHDKQTVVFAGVKTAQCSGGKSTHSAAAQNLSLLREIDVHQFLLVKCNIPPFLSSLFSLMFYLFFIVCRLLLHFTTGIF